jgi:serine phosphatase RsbU (regulator of sigma subunit)
MADGSAAGRSATVIVTSPSGTRTRTSLDPLPFYIGRQSDNHLVLRDNRASRNHARIVIESGTYYVEDLKSSHGVFVNGARVFRQKLYPSDRIEFGFPDSYSLIFTFEDQELHRILDRFSNTQSGGTAGTANLQKLRALVEVARALQNSLSTDDVLASVVDAALAITGFERGFLLLNRGGKLEVSVGRDRYRRNLDKESLDIPLETLREALLHRRELLSMTFDPQSEELSNQTLHGEDLRTVVCIPLVRVRAGNTQETCMITSKNDTVGVIFLDSSQTAIDLSSGNRELLQTLALEASTVLENARLLEEERSKQRMEEELEIAREIQASLLPRKLPSSGWFCAAGSSIPSHAVGGDCFDVRQVAPDAWAAIVTDVSGKGVSSALLAALLQGSFLTGSAATEDIESTMLRINAFLYERTEGEKYATVFYCTICRDGTLVYSNAGHVTPFLVRTTGEISVLDTTGMPIGLLDIATFGVETRKLQPGDKIVAYSDGLTEAQNARGQFFDQSRMKAVIREQAEGSAAEMHSALMREIHIFTDGAVQTDDITALVIQYGPPL